MMALIGIMILFALFTLFWTFSGLTSDPTREEIYEKIAMVFAALTVIVIVVCGISLVIVTLSR